VIVALTMTAAAAVALVFAASGAAHLRHPERTERTVAILGLPTLVASLNAGAVTMMAVGLVAAPRLFSVVAVAYLCGVTVVMLIASRSREISDCGCFASAHRVDLSLGLRNAVIAAAASLVALSDQTPNGMGSVGAVLAVLAGVIGAGAVFPRPATSLARLSIAGPFRHEAPNAPQANGSTTLPRRTQAMQEGSASLRLLGVAFGISLLVVAGCDGASEGTTTRARDTSTSVPTTSSASPSASSTVAEAPLGNQVGWIAIEPNQATMGEAVTISGQLIEPFSTEPLGLELWLVKDKTFHVYDRVCRTTPKHDGTFRCMYRIEEGGDFGAVGPGDYLISVGETWALQIDVGLTITE